MQNGQDLKRPCAFAIDNQIGTDRPKTYIALSPIGANVPHPGLLGQFLERAEEIVLQLVGCVCIVERDEVPDVLQILKRVGRNYVPGHHVLLYASSLPQSRSGLGPWNAEPAIQLVDATVDFLPHF